MENLTKHQLILVALLISFVTSIATGIVTVSLMDQAPKGVTQTVNRIVERTVERVVSEPKKPGEIIKETIIVKEEDKIIEAIEKNAKSMVRIYKADLNSGSGIPLKTFVGLGIIISKEGDIVTDSSIVSSSDFYSAILNDGKEFDLKLQPSQENRLVSFLKIMPRGNDQLALTPAILADSDSLKLGQTVISLGGKLRNSVSIGVITSFVESDVGNQEKTTTPESIILSNQNSTTTNISSNERIFAAANESLKDKVALNKESKKLSITAGNSATFIETNIIPNDNITGNPFINLSSEVVGIRVKALNSGQTMSFVPINEVKKSFSQMSASSDSSKQTVN